MRRSGSKCLLTLLASLAATAAMQAQTLPKPASGQTDPQTQEADWSGASTSLSAPFAVPLSSKQTATPDDITTRRPGQLPSSAMDDRVNCPAAPSTLRADGSSQAEEDASQAGDARLPINCAPATNPADPALPPMPLPQTAIAGDPVRQAEASARAAALQKSHDSADTAADRRAKVPYSNMPALRDLYTQVPSSGGSLRRFGSDAFLFGTGNANQLPSDLPVGPDYVLGPGDQLTVNLWGSRSERLNVTVDRQGQIALPEAGTLVVNGMTIARAQDALQRALNTQFKDEHAEISMGRLRTVRVYVVGDVQRPGAYDVNALSTPLSVLYAAGGPTVRGSLRLLKQMRGDKPVAQVDLYDFLLKGVRTGVEHLQPGDTIMVPPIGQQVTVEGAVHRPAIYELNGETNLQQVLDLAGGLLPTASLEQIEVTRVEANARRTMLSLALSANPAESSKALSGFRVHGQDGVVISRILPYNQQAVYLAGHVFRPGQYAFRPGLTLTDLMRSYQDVLPEPADRGQIVRLVAPDLHPETIPFQLRDVLMGNTPTTLQPFDTVEIFGRYEADAPRVRIEGQVLRPGLYPLSAGMTASALVELAGGLDRSAFLQVAGLTSYTVLNGQSVETAHTDFSLADALAGKQENPVLKPGDVLSIRQMTGWRDIGASITVTGEVAHPGGYGLTAGEHLSSVVRRAGGLRPDAYPEAANFSRVQVQVLGEQARLDMIQRLETAPLEVKPGAMSPSDQQQMTMSLQTQRLQLITALKNHPSSGRMVVSLTTDISKWQGTPDDIVLRAGDTVNIPKRPDFVLISGQVYNPTAVSFAPAHDAAWYLAKGGGATRYGDGKRTYVLRADGSVITGKTLGRNVLHVRLNPGDTVVVPEKLITGSQTLRDVLATAQIVTSLALTAAVAGGL